MIQTQGSVLSSKWTGIVEVCRVTISRYLNAPVRVRSSYRVGYYFIYFPVVVQNTGKRVVLQVHGSVEVCRDHHFEVPISNAPVRVGYGYRFEYYFIYFPVAVQKHREACGLQVDGSVEVCRVTISQCTYKQCAKWRQ